jgi:hypothetical protein
MNKDGAEAKSSPESGLLGWINSGNDGRFFYRIAPVSDSTKNPNFTAACSLSLLSSEARTSRKTARRRRGAEEETKLPPQRNWTKISTELAHKSTPPGSKTPRFL